MKEQEYKTTGIFGNGHIWREKGGGRTVEISFHNGKHLETESPCVDLEKAGCKTLKDAVDKTCHATGFLPTFQKKTFSGTKALVNWFHRPEKPREGYVVIVKKGIRALRFDTSRINFHKMKATTVEDALRKVAFETGAICLENTKA